MLRWRRFAAVRASALKRLTIPASSLAFEYFDGDDATHARVGSFVDGPESPGTQFSQNLVLANSLHRRRFKLLPIAASGGSS